MREDVTLFQVLKYLFGGMASPTPFFLVFSSKPEDVMKWMGLGIIFALLAIASAIASKK